MLRRVATEWFRANFGWFTQALHALFGFIVHQPSFTFAQYASSHSPTPGGVSQLFWVAGLAAFIGGGIAFFYFLTILTLYLPNQVAFDPLNAVHYTIFQEDLTVWTRSLYSAGFYGLTVGSFVLVGNQLPSLQRANAIRDYSAILIDMLASEGEQVGIKAFHFGFTQNPELSFALQILILSATIGALPLKVYYQDPMKSTLTGIVGLIGIPVLAVVAYATAEFTGFQVFPIDAFWAFAIQTLVSFAMLYLLVMVIERTVWMMVYGFREFLQQPIPRVPSKVEMLGSTLILLVALPVSLSYFEAFVTWATFRLSVVNARNVLGTQTTPEPEPERMAPDVQ